MRSAFSGPKTVNVTLTHGDESLSLTLTAPPLGYATYIETVLPDPVKRLFVDGAWQEQPAPNVGEFRDLRFYLLIGKALEPSGELESARNGDNAAAWEKYARDIRAEMQAANLTDEDQVRLGRALSDLRFGKVFDAAEGAPGNA